MRVHAGAFRRIYDPSAGREEKWYINDHCLIRDESERWHLFGITHAEPADPDHEVEFAHATAPNLHGPWTREAEVLTVDPAYGETHLWAPFVLAGADGYDMFYAGGGGDHTAAEINLATSHDLFEWQRSPAGPLFRDGYDARDPDVIRVGDRWVMYYTATDPSSGGNHVVAFRTSDDLRHWGERGIAFRDVTEGTIAGPTESPTVISHGDRWYLFIGPRPGYVGTDIFRSHDPFRFHVDDKVGHIRAHAAEVVHDGEQWWVTGAGWGRDGVWLAPLHWDNDADVAE